MSKELDDLLKELADIDLDALLKSLSEPPLEELLESLYQNTKDLFEKIYEREWLQELRKLPVVRRLIRLMKRKWNVEVRYDSFLGVMSTPLYLPTISVPEIDRYSPNVQDLKRYEPKWLY